MPHDIPPECMEILTRLTGTEAKLEQIITNHLEHEAERNKAVQESLDILNAKIKDLPEFKTYSKIAVVIAGLVFTAVISGYITHIL